MKRKLSSYIGTVFFINVFAIMSVRGICIMMVNDMVGNISHLEKESENVARIYRLNDRIQKAIFTVHSSIIDYDGSRKTDVMEMIDKIEDDLKTYKETEQKEQSPHVNEENILLDKLQDNLVGIRRVLDEIYQNLLIASPLDEIGFKKLEGFGLTIHKT